jgi:NAD(P)-dependent dehydrogenase (short-subunit alcohol dehydrogenase family)
MTSVVHNDTYPEIDSSKADFSGKAVFINGASRGIGRAIGVSYAKAGASMIALGARGDLSDAIKEIREAVETVGKPMPTILEVKFDVTDRKSVDEAAAQVMQAFGRVDIVINNAGKFYISPIVDSDPDVWWNVFQVNMVGPYLVMRAFIPLMLEQGDKTFVTVSSVAACLHTPGVSAYQMAKSAVTRLSEFACGEYGDRGLLAYSIHPGNVRTDMLREVGDLDPIFEPSESATYEHERLWF